MGEVPPCTGKELVKALGKVGLTINSKAGRGSHIKVIDSKTGDSTTVPYGKLSFVREKIVKWAVDRGYSKKKIIKYL